MLTELLYVTVVVCCTSSIQWLSYILLFWRAKPWIFRDNLPVYTSPKTHGGTMGFGPFTKIILDSNQDEFTQRFIFKHEFAHYKYHHNTRLIVIRFGTIVFLDYIFRIWYPYCMIIGFDKDDWNFFLERIIQRAPFIFVLWIITQIVSYYLEYQADTYCFKYSTDKELIAGYKFYFQLMVDSPDSRLFYVTDPHPLSTDRFLRIELELMSRGYLMKQIVVCDKIFGENPRIGAWHKIGNRWLDLDKMLF